MIVGSNAKSLEERVFLALEEEILAGQLKKGDTLTEVALSSRHGVSRTPLRGALHRLAEEGLIEYVLLKKEQDENGEDLFITLDDEDEFEKVANYFDELFDSEVDYDA